MILRPQTTPVQRSLYPGTSMKNTHYQAFSETARNLFGFANMRQNVDQSLNATIDTMTQFAMDDERAGRNADLKGFDYIPM